jgi:WD40 repeat protein
VITKGITNLKFLHPYHLVISGKEGMLGLIEL